MSGPVEVPEVERLREQVRRLEEREAGWSALVESYGQQVERLRAELDADLMERGAMRVRAELRAERDRLTIARIREAAADAQAAADREILRMRDVVQQSNAAAERLQVQADRARCDALTLRVGAIVGVAGAAPNHPGRGVVLHIDSEPARVMVWWIHPDRPRDTLAHPGWSTPEGLRVIG